MRACILALSLVVVACGGDSGANIDANTSGGDGGGGADAVGSPFDASSCQPPDMLFVVDRTMSMHRRPDGTRTPASDPSTWVESKWYIALSTIETVTASLDQTIRFGLSLFPIDRGGDLCVTLEQRINDITATNVQCEGGELLVPPDLGTAGVIANAIDPYTTRLCRSTPIGAGLGTALTELAAIQDPIRDQYVTLLTDGQDTCDEALSLANAQALAAAGINVYVIGFDASGTGVDRGHLNDLACAGKTAPDFATNCMDAGGGNYVATNRDGPTLYFDAGDAGQLEATMTTIAGAVCCNCIP